MIGDAQEVFDLVVLKQFGHRIAEIVNALRVFDLVVAFVHMHPQGQFAHGQIAFAVPRHIRLRHAVDEALVDRQRLQCLAAGVLRAPGFIFGRLVGDIEHPDRPDLVAEAILHLRQLPAVIGPPDHSAVAIAAHDRAAVVQLVRHEGPVDIVRAQVIG